MLITTLFHYTYSHSLLSDPDIRLYFFKMATEVGDNYDSLIKEMELLKGRLDDERSKLNDVARNVDQKLSIIFDWLTISNIFGILSVSTVSQRLESMGQISLKPRRVLKGHQAKVLCADWSSDKRHIVSSSQVFIVVSTLFKWTLNGLD